MMANQQLRLINKDDKVVSYMTMAGNMATIDNSQCDSLLPLPIEAPPPVDLYYKVHLLHEHELDYRASMSKQDRVVGGQTLSFS